MKGNCCLEKGLWREVRIMRLRKQSQFQGRIASPACVGAGFATVLAMAGVAETACTIGLLRNHFLPCTSWATKIAAGFKRQY